MTPELDRMMHDAFVADYEARHPETCPHCGAKPRSLLVHLRDTGGIAIDEGCPVLFARREGR